MATLPETQQVSKMHVVRTSVNAYLKSGLLSLSLCLISQSHAALLLEKNRVIYPGAESQVALKVTNPSEEDYLMQTWIEDESSHPQELLFVNPPLAKIKGKHSVFLTVSPVDNKLLQDKQERLFWLNVKEIPKSDVDNPKPHLSIALQTRIKILFRPKNISPELNEEYKKLEWSRTGNIITITNPTPYYITFNNAWFNGKEKRELKLDMISPCSSLKVENSNKNNTVFYTIIDDYGNYSQPYQTRIN